VKPLEQEENFLTMLHKSNFLIETAVASCSEAMEADTISKNGRGLKSLMSRGNKFLFVCMRTKLIIIALLLITSNLFAQKLYVWCPAEQIPNPRQGFLEKETIDLVIFDGRLLTKNSKIGCTSEKTIAKLTEYIKHTYPSAVINVLTSDQYYKDPVINRITIKIGISAYHAAFGAEIKGGIGSVGGNFSYAIFPEGKWNALTAYAIKIYDYRNGQEIKKTKDIYKTASKPNIGGYKSAKNILNTTYMEVNQEMLFFIDETFMK